MHTDNDRRTVERYSQMVSQGQDRLNSVPQHWFTPTAMLAEEGWPDFTPTALADWASCRREGRDLRGSDCALVLAFARVAYPVDAPGEWRFVAHETGGIWQEAKLLAVRRLALSETGRCVADIVARRWAASNVNAQFASLDQLIEYRSCLEHYGLDCNLHIQSLAEACYPIDLTEAALEILVGEIPAELVPFLDQGTMSLAILSPNCSDL